MSAILKPKSEPEVVFQTLTAEWLLRVLPIENSVYAHPWSSANFVDSMAAGYQMQVLTAGETDNDAEAEILGYFVAMKGYEEVHLLNITVPQERQRQGWAKLMMEALTVWSRGQSANWLWLEVRASNERALQVYKAQGFKLVSVRQDYYPKGPKANGREDAIVMSLKL
jgi:[ribosomal protein S18]-alanine N-acetyltransferase